MKNVIQTLKQAISEYPHTKRYFVAFSGGLDSAVLLHALCESGVDKDRVVALHVDHNLQKSSSDWAAHCAKYCAGLNIRLRVHSVQVMSGSHEEERARVARYAFFSNTVKNDELLLMAHHLNDVAETLLFQLMRGGATAGLTAIPSVRKLGQGFLLRPLLGLHRNVLERYALKNGLSWIQDPSNLDTRYDRNYLRAEILPRLVARWPHAIESLSQSVEYLSEDKLLIDAWLSEHIEKVKISDWMLDLTRLAEYLPSQSKSLIRYWLEQCGWFHISRSWVAEIWRQSRASAMANPQFELPGVNKELEPGHFQVRRYRDTLCLCLIYDGKLAETYDWEILGNTATLKLPHGELIAEVDSALSIDLGSLEVRFPKRGQKVKLPASTNGPARHKLLKAIFQESGIPPWQRVQYPLLYAQDRLIAVPGVSLALAKGEAAIARFYWRPGLPIRLESN
ncbi:MAG: tRNA lysidine(34) synthetase TilS [Pseudomonadales bacterium]|nr:tRNA lysidine(34) synthetase TilS [Pseudomonadales bacterium]